MNRLQLTVIVVVTAVGAGVPLGWHFLRKPAELAGVPIFPGAIEETRELLEYLEQEGYSNVDLKIYSCKENAQKVADWYDANMVERGWCKENEMKAGTEDFFLSYFIRGNEGAVIMIYQDEAMSVFFIFTGMRKTLTEIFPGLEKSSLGEPR